MVQSFVSTPNNNAIYRGRARLEFSRSSRDNRLEAVGALGFQVDQTIYLVILVILFVGIVVWAFGRKRKSRFERDANIPFEDKDG